MLNLKLTWSNLVANRRLYLPFVSTSSAFLALTLLMANFYFRSGDFSASHTFVDFFLMGLAVVLLVSLLLLIYANRFLRQQQRQRLGLYTVLGFGRRELSGLLLTEKTLLWSVTVVVGSGLGIVFARVGELAFRRLLQQPILAQFGWSAAAWGFTVACFTALFGLLLLLDLISIWRQAPESIRQQARAGEREPKSHKLLAVLGVLLIGGGYALALSLKQPDQAMVAFGVAVVLVALGTIALMVGTSISLLKWLKRRFGYYYQPRHFINTGNMLFRMRQNGLGLAAIAILTTMTILTAAVTSAMYLSIDAVVDQTATSDLLIQDTGEPTDPDNPNAPNQLHSVSQLDSAVRRALSGSPVQIRSRHVMQGERMGDLCEVINHELVASNRQSGLAYLVMTQAQYRRFTKRSFRLKAGHIGVNGVGDHLKFKGHRYQVQSLGKVPFAHTGAQEIKPLVVKDQRAVERWLAGDDSRMPLAELNYMLSGTKRQQAALVEKVRGEIFQIEGVGYALRADDYYTILDVLARFLFIGVILGVAFLIATALILYNRQVAEGLADAKRYRTLRRIGLSQAETRKTVNSQVLTLFSLPLVIALIHVTVAMVNIKPIMVMFGLTWPVVVRYAVIVAAVFVIVYLALYWLTARTYYRIVSGYGTVD